MAIRATSVATETKSNIAKEKCPVVKKNPDYILEMTDYEEAAHDLAQLITPAILMRSKVTKKSPAYLQYFFKGPLLLFFREYLPTKKSTIRENDFILLFCFSFLNFYYESYYFLIISTAFIVYLQIRYFFQFFSVSSPNIILFIF